MNMVKEFLFTGPGGEHRKRNLIGVSTDGASNMVSKESKGAVNRLQSEIPGLISQRDLCHAFNKIIENSLKQFPLQYRNFVTVISQTFSHSSIKSVELKGFLQSEGEKVEGLRKYIPTRWTLFAETLDRIIQLYPKLQLFFGQEAQRL